MAILGVTVFLYVDSQNYVNFENTSDLYMTPFLLLMALGAIMTLVGFLGCCGAVRESTCILGTVSGRELSLTHSRATHTVLLAVHHHVRRLRRGCLVVDR